MLSFIIPTHNRPDDLATTLARLDRSPAVRAEDEIIIIDNASTPAATAPARLTRGTPITLIRRDTNDGAAARNIGAKAARGEWLIMLDDDSSPTTPLAEVLARAPEQTVAIGGDIRLPSGGREAGGLPEVIIGCGCAIRRAAFLDVGGYDPTFDYYVEEYDLCARFIHKGWTVTHTGEIAFEHRKAPHNRDFSRILSRLVRNNAWTIARYAPDGERDAELARMFDRYGCIATKEGVSHAFRIARDDAEVSLSRQPRRPLSVEGWARFTGVAALRRQGIATLVRAGVARVRLARPGKGADVVESELRRVGIEPDPDSSEAIIATLSPGPMLDASETVPGRATLPWTLSTLTRAG